MVVVVAAIVAGCRLLLVVAVVVLPISQQHLGSLSYTCWLLSLLLLYSIVSIHKHACVFPCTLLFAALDE